MCDETAGVVKKIEAQRVFKEISDLLRDIEKETRGEEVTVPVPKIKTTKEKLDALIR